MKHCNKSIVKQKGTVTKACKIQNPEVNSYKHDENAYTQSLRYEQDVIKGQFLSGLQLV